MALGKPQEVTESEYNSYNLQQVSPPPEIHAQGHPDDGINVRLGGWKGTDTMGFTVEGISDVDFNVGPDGDALTLSIDARDGNDPDSQVKYYLVEMGSGNGKGDSWSLSFQVYKNETKTGKWIFTKSKSDDDSSKKRGCLGFLFA